jgi:hypothetical protein
MPPVALAYGQVNDSFFAKGSFQAIKAHRSAGLKKAQPVCSASNAPVERGDGEPAKTRPSENH